MHKGPSPTSEAALHDECVPCGNEYLWDGGSICERNRIWDAHCLSFVNNKVLRVCPTAYDAHHFVAHLQCSYSRSYRTHYTRKLHTWNIELIWKRIWIETHALQQVGTIEAGCTNLHQHFFRTRSWGNNFFERQYFGATMAPEHHRTHCRHLRHYLLQATIKRLEEFLRGLPRCTFSTDE